MPKCEYFPENRTDEIKRIEVNGQQRIFRRYFDAELPKPMMRSTVCLVNELKGKIQAEEGHFAFLADVCGRCEFYVTVSPASPIKRELD
jgi:hypothetical protein